VDLDDFYRVFVPLEKSASRFARPDRGGRTDRTGYVPEVARSSPRLAGQLWANLPDDRTRTSSGFEYKYPGWYDKYGKWWENYSRLSCPRPQPDRAGGRGYVYPHGCDLLVPCLVREDMVVDKVTAGADVLPGAAVGPTPRRSGRSTRAARRRTWASSRSREWEPSTTAGLGRHRVRHGLRP